MAITVKHKFVSTIPDGDDTSVVRPSNWNDTHELTGLGTMAEQNANSVAITGGTISGVSVSGYIPTSAEGVANGVATLDSNGQVPLSQIPALGDLNYQGTWNATTNTPTLTSSVGTKGYYYVVSVAGTTNLNGITDWQIGDWAVYSGTAWQKIDNTDSVTSVNGKTGTVVLTNTDISGFGTMSTQNANSVAITGGTIDGTTIGGTTPAVITGSTVNANTKVVSPDYYAQSILGGNLRTSGGTSLLNWDGGGSGNITVNGGLIVDPSNKNINLSPTGTGSITIAPATTGSLDNVVIGATTPKAITGTTVTATTFSGSGASLTSIPNSALNNSAITINGTSTSLGGSISVGTVTSVTGTSPVVSSGGTTPAISMPAATTSVSGYLTSTDWNTFNSKGSGTVTSVSATSPITSTGGTTPTIAMPAATTSVNGYLTSTDWNTFNNKQPAGTYINSVSGTTNQITASTTSGAVTVSLPSSVTTGQYIGNQTITSSSVQGAFAYGSLGYSDVNHILTMAASQNSYIQMEIQNTNAGAAASSDVIVGNNNTTASTYYGDFGMNSSGWAGTGAFTAPNNVYLTATSGDLALGTTTSNSIRFAVNGGTTDAMTINASGALALNGSYGTSGQFLKTNGSGSAPTWATVSASPAGSTTQVQYNLSGSFAGSSSFTFDANNNLTAPQVVASNGLVLNAKTNTTSYTIGTGQNAMSVGPFTTAGGTSITVPAGSRWIIL